MNRFIRKAGVLLLLVSGMVFANEQDQEQGYRIAGIIASDTSDWRAIIELPDGKQQLVSEGDIIGSEKKRVEIVKISKEGVTLQFPDGEKQMQLSQGERQIQQFSGVVSSLSPDATDVTGVKVSDFSKLLEKKLSKDQSASVMGLEHLSSLPESARLVSFSNMSDPDEEYIPIKSLSSAVSDLHKAIVERKGLRIMVEGDPKNTHIYIIPKHQN